MNKREEKIIKEAIRKYKRIYPLPHKATLYECFTYYDNRLLFWFNTKDYSTHLIVEKKAMLKSQAGKEILYSANVKTPYNPAAPVKIIRENSKRETS